MTRKICKIAACGARAWHGELCNLHALERVRGNPKKPLAQRLEVGKRLLKEKARELGIVLADEAEAIVEVSRGRKVRSPMI
jgi:hypothetical protein